ncbi:MAG: D-amino acid aminotransferase, partial [Rhizobiales bacterium]|nr:D-amino acid aminotransferase [Hyphomicrobiales bacterium]
MSRVAYVNGQFIAHRHAGVSIDDRGYQFADGVYEVFEIKNYQIIDLDGHLNRLDYSLSELEISPPMARNALIIKLKQIV